MKQNLQTIKKVDNTIQLFNNAVDSGQKFNKIANLTFDFGAYVK